ncbi:TetR/AcrR family transcriptional regulator [Amycolatopsis lurida]
MQVNEGSQPELGLSVTEAARRAQIIQATIEVIAELGFAKTSFARIVEHAGLSSTRMISYHFGSKEELMSATIGQISQLKDEFMTERLAGDTTRAGMLRGFIESEAAFVAAYPAFQRAMNEILGQVWGGQEGGGHMFHEAVLRDMRVGRIERQLAQGQREGAFGEFDIEVMALSIRQALDGLANRLVREPELDAERYGRELATLFEKATRP